MALDLKKMKQKQIALQGNGNGKRWFWKPQDGEQTIRIVPDAGGDPFREFWFHYNLGDKPGFLSPKRNFGEDCPLDTFVRKLWEDGSDESREMAKKLMAKQRFFSPVLVRGEEEQGIRLWGYGKMAYKELLNLVLNPEYGDITDVNEGTDLVINYGKPVGAQFPQTTITPRRRPSKLSEKEDEVLSLLDSIPDYNDVFDRKTPDQVQAMLDEFLLDEEDAEDVSSESNRYNSQKSSVDQAFDELLSS